MKTKLLQLALVFFTAVATTQAQYRNWNTDCYQNDIDLQKIVSVFNNSMNISDFERNLNELNYQEFQLDLNQDNQIDFLRVTENGNKYSRYVNIQAVMGYNGLQDVATIEIRKNRFYNKLSINIFSNLNPNQMYNSEVNYYNTRPIYASFWMPSYRFYISSFTWNRYPSYYRCEPYWFRRNHSVTYNYYGRNNSDYDYHRNNHLEDRNYEQDNHRENYRRDDSQRNHAEAPRYNENNNEYDSAKNYNTDISVNRNVAKTNISNRFILEKSTSNNAENSNENNTENQRSHPNSRRF